ncbi:hypothetical protein SAMN05444920_13441 [Nonomuraea solani]|uniref:WD40-like Beta Propeller Repeat n=1 Tax=Nonomuraea solani TaxID=1144553 RepID=A0A1H6EZC0_9ACTN|nr:hypothetical protein [Nonomuraea solani]SEH03237.1 hypothetical protein SAMN05444920_13441 [Nonomuraea solani]
MAISRDGRLLAYYSPEAGAYVVRDLVSGSETTSPVKIGEDELGGGSMLLVSDQRPVPEFRSVGGDPGLLIGFSEVAPCAR